MMRRTTLNWTQLFQLMELSVRVRVPESLESKNWRDAMVNALQINFALWGMIGCAAYKSMQLIQYIN
jgi:hypothetical protein